VELMRFALVALVACSGGKARTAEDARAGAKHSPDGGEVKIDPTGKGDVQIRVEWKNVPVAARASPGATSCGSPRPPAVAPTTTWGIPDVFVELDAPGSGGGGVQRIALAGCTLAPRAIVASKVTIASTSEQPSQLRLQQVGKLPLGSALAPAANRDVYLPIAGHEVETAFDVGTIHVLQLGDEQVTIVSSESPFVAVTEPNGQVTFHAVPAGTHAVTAWLPARSGQPARISRGKVIVGGGALAEITLDITTP